MWLHQEFHFPLQTNPRCPCRFVISPWDALVCFSVAERRPIRVAIFLRGTSIWFDYVLSRSKAVLIVLGCLYEPTWLWLLFLQSPVLCLEMWPLPIREFLFFFCIPSPRCVLNHLPLTLPKTRSQCVATFTSMAVIGPLGLYQFQFEAGGVRRSHCSVDHTFIVFFPHTVVFFLDFVTGL